MSTQPNIELSHGTLSEIDLDVLSGMMVVFMHAAEKCIQTMELHYEAEYRAGAEYKQLCRVYGKSLVDAMVQNRIRKVIRGDERNNLGKLLKIAKDFHRASEALTNHTTVCHSKETTDSDSFDGLMHDVNYLCYMYALMGNCIGADDEIKLISTVKAMAKGDRVSNTVLDKFKIN